MDLEKTQKILKQKMADKEFDTYAIVVHKGEKEWFLHSDNADKDTYFDVASMGKILVTSTLALKAVDEKKLSLGDTLDMFFKKVPSPVENITVKQLLTHTSGIVRCEISDKSVKEGNDAIAVYIMNNPLAFNPGESGQYSCNGMILLGFILEKIYNMPLEKIFEEKIKKTLNYTRSKFNIAVNEPNSAICYRSENVDGFSSPWDDENIRILQTSSGSGGQFFSISDIKKFADAVIKKSELLYSKEIFEQAEKNYVMSEELEGRGLGWLYVNEKYYQKGKLFPVGSFGHTGFTGMSMFFNRNLDMYVIMLTNATRFSAKKHNFKTLDYEGDTCRIRVDLHNAIFEDLTDFGLI